MITLVTISYGVWARVLRCNAIVWKVFLIYSNRMFQHYKRLFSPLHRSTYNSSPCSCLPMLPPRECEAQGERVSDEQQKGVKHGAKEAIEKVRSHEHAQILSRKPLRQQHLQKEHRPHSFGAQHLQLQVSAYTPLDSWRPLQSMPVCVRAHVCVS